MAIASGEKRLSSCLEGVDNGRSLVIEIGLGNGLVRPWSFDLVPSLISRALPPIYIHSLVLVL